MTPDVWVHNLDPFVFKLTETFGVRWYSLAYLSAFAFGFLFASWLVRNKRVPLTMDDISDQLTFMIVGTLLGGRIGYVLFYSPDLLTDFRGQFPYWGALAVWEGGMASHGGFIGVILGCLWVAWRKKLDPLLVGDMVVVGAAIGFFFGRIANFINGELMGRVAPATMSWAVKFPQDIYRWIGYEPGQLPKLAATVKELGVSETDWSSWVSTHAQGRLYGVADQIILAVQNGNAAVTQQIAQVLEPRHPSQLYAAMVEGLIPLLFMLFLWRKPRKPGVLSATYLIFYAVARIVNEMFRLPDAQLSDLSKLPLGLTRGQFLSIWFIIFGLIILYIAMKRDKAKIGGICFAPELAASPPKKQKKKK